MNGLRLAHVASLYIQFLDIFDDVDRFVQATKMIIEFLYPSAQAFGKVAIFKSDTKINFHALLYYFFIVSEQES